jgi:phosphatidylserine decarboxylase
MSAPDGLRGRAFVLLQHVLPQHAISRLVLAATRSRAVWFKNALIGGFLRLFEVDMSDAATEHPQAFASFNDFFTRPLKAGRRPVADAAIVSPVDGTVSECGRIDADRLLQAKGRDYRLGDLLAHQPWAQAFEGGDFCTIYLAPYNYHRIHMPAAGNLRATVYVPGRLCSVNAVTARHVPQLVARNERVLTLFDTGLGAMGVVLVGALNVGSMATVWAGDITPARRRVVTALPNPNLHLDKAAELGRFNMGSTVILLFEPGRIRWLPHLAAGRIVRVGEAIAQALEPAPRA